MKEIITWFAPDGAVLESGEGATTAIIQCFGEEGNLVRERFVYVGERSRAEPENGEGTRKKSNWGQNRREENAEAPSISQKSP